MAAPIGTCYPASGLPDSFSRNIKIIIGIFLQRSTYKKYSNDCFPEQNDPDWVLVHQFPWYRAGTVTMNFTLNFNINPNFKPGDDLRTYYDCTNKEEYIQQFAIKEAEANQKGVELASEEERDIPDTVNVCNTCDEKGITIEGRTVRKQKVQCISKTQVVQVVAPGCN